MEKQNLHTLESENFKISNSEWNEISQNLEEKHALFYQCWQMGRPIFTKEIERAAVSFGQTGEYIEFLFNPEYWNKLSNYERLFVISHECLHVILNHGLRATTDSSKIEKNITNVALDIVVNHMLVNSFGFKRDKISMWKNLCWVDTVFEELDKVPEDSFFEYYYNLIKSNNIDKDYLILDIHDMSPNDWGEVIKRLNDSLSTEEKNAIKPLIKKHSVDKIESGKEAGDSVGNWKFVNVEFKKTRKWESIIKNWIKKYIIKEMESKEQWVRLNRRFNLLGSNLFLPTEVEEETEDKSKIPIYMFIDTSASCYRYKNRFINLAASIPEDRFIAKVFTFDTVVKEVDMDSAKIKGVARMHGWGGTRFKILHEKLEKDLEDNNEKHPEVIFVLTDGYGDKINPSQPERWHWLLTPGHTKFLIPKESYTYDLRQFE